MRHITKSKINNRIHLIAEEGYYITDGDTIYSKYLILAEGLDSYTYYAIAEEEYNRKMEEQNNDTGIFDS